MIRLFRVFIPVGVLALLISEVILVSACFVFAAYVVLTVDPTVFLFYDGGLWRIALVVGSILFGLHFHDLYSRIHVKSKIVLMQQLCFVTGMAFLAQGLISYLSRDLRMPIRLMVFGSVLAGLGILIWRIFYSKYVLQVVGAQRVLFLGGSSLIEKIAGYITEHPESGLAVAGYVDDAHAPGTPRKGGEVLGGVGSLAHIASELKPDRIIVGMSERRGRMPVAELLDLRFSGFVIEEAGAAYEAICSRISTNDLRPSHLIFSGELGPRPKVLFAHNAFDFVVALIGTVVAIPFMLFSALAVKLSSPGPILYRQKRVGLNGAVFFVYKFRSMYVDAEAKTGAVWASKDDPRVTRVGKIMRKLRLDELPQLFNVLRGEMSIVGPRPERPEFVKTLSEQIPYYRQRHCVKPGITGWAQINYKYGDRLEDTIKKLEYDLYYIKNMSLSLDTYIIFHTVKTMLLSRGAQ